MTEMPKTSERILEASRRLFNEKGYAATTLTEIAAALGISQGNLTYHFSTKRKLVQRLQEQARSRTQARRAAYIPGNVADDYIEHLLFAMEHTWNNRFLLSDRAQFAEPQDAPSVQAELAADFKELSGLLERVAAAGYFRRDLPVDITGLTRSLWIVSRYWMDHLREMEGRNEITWADQERGIQHHFALLLPCLTATAREQFEKALTRATSESAN